MSGYVQGIYQGVTTVSTREVMGGLLVGLVLALAVSGGYLLIRKRTSDPLPVFFGLILLASVFSMAFGLGHSRYQADRSLSTSHPSGNFRVSPPPIGRRLIEDADFDGDGRLTTEEVVRYVNRADLAGKGWVSANDIDRAQRALIGPRPVQNFHPDSARRPSLREGF